MKTVTSLLLSLLFLSTCIAKPAQKPNVLFIAIDDLRTDLNCYGNSQIHSPNIDQLAQVGTLFERAYCQQAVCNPSRSSMLTGLRLDTLNIWDLPTHFRQRIPDVVTLPQLFKQNGYHTQCVGKIFHNWRQDDFRGDAVSWSAPQEMHYNSHGNDKAMVQGEVPPNLSDVPKCVIRDVPDKAYFDGPWPNEQSRCSRNFRINRFSWPLVFGNHIHTSTPRSSIGICMIQLRLSCRKTDFLPRTFRKLPYTTGRKFSAHTKNLPNQYPTDHQAREMRRGYYANISYMDAQVGKVLDELDRLQLRDNTIIVLWSDHGFHLGENSLWAKTSNFELDARVPMIISTPQFNRKQSTESLVELLDIYPTLTDLCRLPSPDNLEGKSLVPILKHPQAKVKPVALTQHCRPAYLLMGKTPKPWGIPSVLQDIAIPSGEISVLWMSLLRNFMTITRIPAKQIMSLTTRRQAFENS